MHFGGLEQRIRCSGMRFITRGDLIFQVLEMVDESKDAVQPAQEFHQAVSQSVVAESVESIPVNHVGLAINAFQVIEAITSSGVVVTDLPIFLARSTKNIVARIKAHVRIESAICRAKTWIGTCYNASFYPDQTGFYCSELITEAFTESEEDRYFQLYPMNFKGLITQKILPYWINYYEKLNMPIPQGVIGSHPEQLLKQHDLFSDIFRVNALYPSPLKIQLC